MSTNVTVVIALPTNGNPQFIYGVFESESLARAHVDKWADREHNYRFSVETVITKSM